MRDIRSITSREAQPFWNGLAVGVLRVQRCRDTGRLIFPPTPTSPFGAHRRPEWIDVSGKGRVWSFIVAHPPLIGQFADVAPYVSVLVELEEDPGVRLAGALVAAPGAPLGSVSGASVRIGQSVKADFAEVADGRIEPPRWVLREA